MANFTPQQIEQFLQEFFDVVGARQYIGARYVPIFGRAGEDTVEWDDGAPYEPLTVVMHEGVSYVSRRYVPNGIQVTDTDYWVETYRFNAQVEQYRQEVLSFQGQIDRVREDMESDYVPFPDPATYAKYGTLGQVLTTLTGGGTKWEDPVTVTADVAEPLIEEWLDSHPEATTTVQDNSITDVKINNDSSIVKIKTFPSDETLIRHVLGAGIYAIMPATAPNITDFPSEADNTEKHTLLNIKENSVLTWQVLTNIGSNKYWVRAAGYNSAGAWHMISPADSVKDGIITDAKVNDGSSIVKIKTFPADETLIRHVLGAGIYAIMPATVADIEDLPFGANTTFKHTLLNIKENSVLTWQVLTNEGSNMYWVRAAGYDHAAVWHRLQTVENDYDYKSSLTNKVWYVLGDSATHGDFTGITQPPLQKGMYAGELPVYPFYIGNRNGMVVHNLAKNGATLATLSDTPTDSQISAEGFYDTVGTDANYITLWAGANDMWHNVPIGTIDDTTSDTYYGAYNKVLTYFINNRPNAKLGLVASFWCTEPYVTATLNIGKKYGIPVLNLYNDPNIPVTVGSQNPDVATSVKDARNTQYKVSASNNHPNAKYHEMESFYIEKWLETL